MALLLLAPTASRSATRGLVRALRHPGLSAARQCLPGSKVMADHDGFQLQLGQRRTFKWYRNMMGQKEAPEEAAEGSPASSEASGGSKGSADEAATSAEPKASSEDGAIVPVRRDSGGLRQNGQPFQPNMVALPLARRPLFPGMQQMLQVTHPTVIKDLMKRLELGNAPLIVAAFLHRSAGKEGSSSASAAAKFDGESDVSNPLEDLSHGDALGLLHHTGTRARIVQAAPFNQQGKDGDVDGIQLLLQGLDLIRLEKVLDKGPPTQVQVTRVVNKSEEDNKDTLKAYINETMHTIREIMKINPQFREHASMIHHGLERLERGDPHAIAHFGASLSTATGDELMGVIEADLPSEKLRLALLLLKKELEVSQLQQKLVSKIEEKVNSHQREFMLREQMKQIKKELGEDKSDGTDALLQKFRERLEGKTVPKEAKEAIDSEVEKFSQLAKESQEYQTTRNYLDWLTTLPWGVNSTDTLSLKKAKRILDRDHYGLPEVKERILELIAVGALKGTVQGKIVCFVGPPGVGKTSIGRSIAEALGREFYRFSVGGLYDVAEIKGHRRTYVGAMPGKVIQCLKKVQTDNPLVLIDEVDKIGRGHQGDPASALLELLDPSQNGSFLDHYLDVPVDCSRILFVCTANVTDTIPGPLLDRMEVIRLSGYDLQEKLQIAEDYLVPNTMREVGLWPPIAPASPDATTTAAESSGEQMAENIASGGSAVEKPTESIASDGGAIVEREEVAQKIEPVTSATKSSVELAAEGAKATIESNAISALIRWYCREAGVRNLQKHIEKISRKLVTKLVEKSEQANEETDVAAEAVASDTSSEDKAAELQLTVTEDNLSDYVGKPLFNSDRLYEGQLPAGTVTGLAWTALGGSVLYVEASGLPRVGGNKASPQLNVTGQLGSVMKESSQIALLVARRQALARGAEAQSFFDENELYLHCPEGATPKDGPSAGVTMTTALLSLSLGCPVRTDLAMTGEVSLNGKVLPVGGIKEKTIAARRAGCKALVFPQANRRDFDELPEYLRDGLEVHYAAEYDDVFAVAFPELQSTATSNAA